MQMQKRKIFIQANCQGGPIQKIFTTLERLKERYEVLPIEAVHLWKKEEKAHQKIIAGIKEADIFLHQIISVNFGYYASDELKAYLKSDAVAISFPTLYFTGYHPQSISLKDNVGRKIAPPIAPHFASYHDINIVNGYRRGVEPEALKNIFFDEDFYSSDSIKNNIRKGLFELQKREKSITIKLTAAIEASMMEKKLFHTMNHPTNELMFLLVDKILEKLGEETLAEEEKVLFPEEMLGQIQTPLYRSVQKYFGFNEPTEELFQGKRVSVEAIIDQYYNLYRSLPFLNEKSETLFTGLAGFAKESFLDQQRVMLSKKLYLNNKKEEIMSAAKAGYSYDLIARAATVELMKTDLPESFTLQTEQGDEVIVGTKFWPREIERICKSEAMLPTQ